MIRKLTGLTFVFWFVFSVRGEVVRIGERVEVEAELLSLGDIAQILPANPEIAGISIGYAPYPGHYRWLTKPDIQNYLHRWGLDQKVELQMSERVLITRDSQQIQAGVIEQKVLDFLRSLNPAFEFSIEQIQMPENLYLPVGSIEMSIDPPPSVTRLDGMSLKLDFFSEGERLRSQWVRVDAVAKAQVVVLNKDVSYGEPLRRADLKIEPRHFDRLEGVFTSLDDVVDCVAKRSLTEGEILTQRDLKEAVLVQRGDVVTLLVRGPAFVVSALGRSRDSGARGDAVVIENLDSKQLVHATVVGQKMVQVVVAGGVR